MQTRRSSTMAVLVFGAVALAACSRSPAPAVAVAPEPTQAAAPGGELVYRRPEGPPAPPFRTAVLAAGDAALQAAAQAIQESGFQVAQVDPGRGIVVAIYRGDPEPYVDCGGLRPAGAGDAPWRQAAAQQMEVASLPLERDWRALRQMLLDARIVSQVQPGEASGALTTQASYVLTRTIATLDTEGRVVGNSRETIHFDSGGTGRFARGTTCLPKGTLERQIGTLVAEAAAARPAGDQPGADSLRPPSRTGLHLAHVSRAAPRVR